MLARNKQAWVLEYEEAQRKYMWEQKYVSKMNGTTKTRYPEPIDGRLDPECDSLAAAYFQLLDTTNVYDHRPLSNPEHLSSLFKLHVGIIVLTAPFAEHVDENMAVQQDRFLLGVQRDHLLQKLASVTTTLHYTAGRLDHALAAANSNSTSVVQHHQPDGYPSQRPSSSYHGSLGGVPRLQSEPTSYHPYGPPGSSVSVDHQRAQQLPRRRLNYSSDHGAGNGGRSSDAFPF